MVKNFAPGEQNPKLEEILIDEAHLKQFLEERCQKIGLGVLATSMPDGRKAAVNAVEYHAAVDGFLKGVFKKYGQLSLRDLLDIKLRVREDVFKYEVKFFFGEVKISVSYVRGER